MRNVVRVLSVVFISALVLSASASTGDATTVTQVTVSTDLAAQTYDFQITWNGTPNFSAVDSVWRPEDSFSYSIINPTIAANYPGTTLQTYAGAIQDYSLLGQFGEITISGYSFDPVDHYNSGTVIGEIPYSLDGDVVDFAIAMSLLKEPDGFVYLFGNDFFGSQLTTLTGDSSGFPGTSATPLPGTLPLFAAGLGLFGLIGWRKKRGLAVLPT